MSATSPRRRTPTPASTRRFRRRRRRSSVRRSGSRSSSTATRTRTSLARTGCRHSCSSSSRTRTRTWRHSRRRSRTSGTPCRSDRLGSRHDSGSPVVADLSADITPVVPGQPVGTPGVALSPARVGGHYSLLTRRDKAVIGLMVGIPLIFDLILIWGPTIASVLLSFTKWNGIGGITAEQIIGTKNYESLFSSYPFFWPALQHNLLWLAFLMFIA